MSSPRRQAGLRTLQLPPLELLTESDVAAAFPWRTRPRTPPITASEKTIKIAYAGSGVADGTMSVQELAPALLAVGDLFERANSLLHGKDASVEVRVRSDFETGSFEVKLLVVASLFDAAKDFLLSDNVNAAEKLAKLLGFGKSGFTTVLGAIKRLRGKKPKSVTTLENGNVQLVLENYVHIELPQPVYQLVSDDAIRVAARDVVRPLRREEVSEFRVLENGEVVERVTDEEEPAFEEAASSGTLEEPSDLLLDNVSERVLEIRRPAFAGNLTWDLYEGENRIPVRMRDEAFLRKVESREITFGAHDLLRLKLRTRASRTPRGSLRTDHEVTEVLEVIPATPSKAQGSLLS